MEKIEIAMRTQIIHQLAIPYGSHWQLNETLFRDVNRFNSQNKEPRRKQRGILKKTLSYFTPRATGNMTRRDSIFANRNQPFRRNV
jgi:hypothetical protein